METAGQREVTGEVIFLLRKWRVVPVPIKARLAQRDNALGRRQAHHLVPVSGRGLGRVVGLDADGGNEDVGMAGGEIDGYSAGGGGRGDGHDADDARSAGSLQDRGEVIAELL